jgi:probable F420-dependent oxidoreductase
MGAVSDTKVEVGVLLPTREAVMSGATSARPILELAERAEALGFDSLWVGDSITARPRFEALTTLAAVAARTRRVKVGTAVLLPHLRHPVVLAHQIANLDVLAEGRLILGLGVGPKGSGTIQESAAVGVPFEKRLGIWEEGVDLMRRLWRGPSVSFEGRHFRIADVALAPRPVQAGGPPLWLGGSAEGAMRRAARHGHGWMPISPTPAAFAESYRRVQTLAGEAGRDPAAIHPALYTTINIGPDEAVARQEMRAFIEQYYGVPFERLAASQGHSMGTGEAVAKDLAAFVAAGVRTLVLRFGAPDQGVQLERCARDVLPRLRALRG